MLNPNEDLSHMTKEEKRAYLKKKLRQRTGKGDAPHAMQQQLKKDPTGALLSLGIDDPSLLSNAKSLIRHPQAALSNAQSMLSKIKQANSTKQVEEEEEGLPPEFDDATK